MRYSLPTVCLAALLLTASLLSAQTPDDSIDRARFGLAQSLINLAELDQAQPLLDDLHQRYPDNRDILIQYLIVLSGRQQYTQAVTSCRHYLANHPDDTNITLWLARCLSWDQQYDRAIAAYDTLIDAEPNSPLAIREQARVLGWHRQYRRALAAYDQLVRSHPDRAVFAYEMQAKKALYNQHHAAAVTHYRQWLTEEPNNPEALYDLAQVYSTLGRWSDAQTSYQRLLSQYGSHHRARQALAKTQLYRQAPRLDLELDFIHEDSGDRNVDRRTWSTTAAWRTVLNEQVAVTVNQANRWHQFDGLSQVYQQQFGVVLDYQQRPSLWASVNLSRSIYDHHDGVPTCFGGQLNVKPADAWTVALSHQRQAILDNRATFLDRLYVDHYTLRTIYQPYRRLTAGADYRHSDFSDDNRRITYGMDIGYYLTLEPDSLRVSYRYEQYNYAHEAADYFSPDSFHTHTIAAEWRHFFNTDELFWGSNDTYSTVRYGLIIDTGQQIGHQIQCALHHDWTDRCSSHIEYSRILYDHQDIYRSDRCMIYTSWYF